VEDALMAGFRGRASVRSGKFRLVAIVALATVLLAIAVFTLLHQKEHVDRVRAEVERVDQLRDALRCAIDAEDWPEIVNAYSALKEAGETGNVKGNEELLAALYGNEELLALHDDRLAEAYCHLAQYADAASAQDRYVGYVERRSEIRGVDVRRLIEYQSLAFAQTGDERHAAACRAAIRKYCRGMGIDASPGREKVDEGVVLWRSFGASHQRMVNRTLITDKQWEAEHPIVGSSAVTAAVAGGVADEVQQVAVWLRGVLGSEE
jgi:hypothetical protein